MSAEQNLPLGLTFTGGRAWAPNTHCFVHYSAGDGGTAKEWEVGLALVGDGGAVCVEVLTSTTVPSMADVWRGPTLDTWEISRRERNGGGGAC